MQDVPHTRRIQGRLARVSWIMLIFVGLGPLIGLVVFAVGMTALGLASEPRSGTLLVLPFFLLYGLFFAHFVGAASAALAGAVASAIYGVTQRKSAWIGPISGAVALGAAIAYAGVQAPRPPAPGAAPSGWTSDAGIVLVLSATHVLAATGAWLVARQALPASAPDGATS
ncbi:MAG: hypothetical protein R3D68_08175 [Hyphomicrobiaceae bacterium]